MNLEKESLEGGDEVVRRIVHVARAVNARRTQDGPIEAGRSHQPLRPGLGAPVPVLGVERRSLVPWRDAIGPMASVLLRYWKRSKPASLHASGRSPVPLHVDPVVHLLLSGEGVVRGQVDHGVHALQRLEHGIEVGEVEDRFLHSEGVDLLGVASLPVGADRCVGTFDHLLDGVPAQESRRSGDQDVDDRLGPDPGDRSAAYMLYRSDHRT